MSSKISLLIALGLVLTLTTANARAQEAEEDSLRRAFVGLNLVGAFPTGAFKNYVGTGGASWSTLLHGTTSTRSSPGHNSPFAQEAYRLT
jgi:hypothetical protein